MDHESAQALLSEYLEETLDPARRAELEAHLQACDTCRADLELLRRTLNLVKAMPRPEAPANFSSKVRRRLRRSGLGGASVTRWARLVPYEATLVVLLATVGALIIIQLLQPPDEPIPDETPPVMLTVGSRDQANAVARATWQAGGEVHALGRLVPPGTELGAPLEMDLSLPPAAWASLREALRALGLSPGEPRAGPDGKLRLVVVLVSRPPT